jgi:hypothetical protein
MISVSENMGFQSGGLQNKICLFLAQNKICLFLAQNKICVFLAQGICIYFGPSSFQMINMYSIVG